MKKTNAARLLDGLGLDYELLQFEIDEDDLGAEYVAAQLELPLNQIFKTLVLRGNKNGVFVCCIPGGEELDLKQAARITSNKKVEMVPSKEILALTGYIRGGCSPLSMKRNYPTFLDSGALEHSTIVISAGARGLQIKLTPASLVKATNAQVQAIVI